MMEISGHTLVDKVRCFMLYQYAKSVSCMSGDVAEIGVYKGGTARLLARTLQPSEKKIHLFDTFSGMPATDNVKDYHRKGDFGDTCMEKVSELLKDCSNVLFYQGLFPDTAKPVAEKSFCLVHVYVDIYRSVIDCCEFFYPRL
ncbi:MAG: hypothetical protein HZB80_08300 [Deltaproteobacteria bacterium]|nr:hypothetical protein [Deltaproteobacteria bacterium]